MSAILEVPFGELASAMPRLPLRVALMVSGFPHSAEPSRGIFNLRAAKALSRHVNLHVIFTRAWKPGRPFAATSVHEGLPVTTLAVPQVPGFPLLNLALYRRLGWPLVRSLLRNCDLIHSVDVCLSIVASAWAARFGLRHVAQAIGSDVNSILPVLRHRRPILGWEQHVDAVTCNSEALADAFRILYPQVRNVRTIYRGIDPKAFQPQGTAEGPLCNRPPVRFLFLGGFQPYPALPHRENTKGGETLLAAWKAGEELLAAAGASLLVGGIDADGPRVAQWHSGLEYPDRVIVSGPIQPANVAAYLRSADVVLIPSMEEGMPNLALEASACGRAVFGSNVGGLPEVVAHGETGLILPAGDATAWRDALVDFVGRFDTLRAMGERARQRVESRFDCAAFAPQMLELYQVALAGAASGRR